MSLMAHSNPRSLTGRSRSTVGGQNAGIYSALAKVWAMGPLPTKEVGMTRGDPDALPGTRREWGSLLSLQFA